MSDNLDNQTATLASVIQQAVNNKLLDVHTSMPGIITAFDTATQLASVQPAIRRVFKTVDSEDRETLKPTDLPILINVPVEFPSGGGFYLTFPVKVNDECVICFNERSIDNWNQDGGISDPSAFRQHSLSDAFVRVGVRSQPNKISSFSSSDVDLRNSNKGQRITLKANGDVEIETTSAILIKGSAITLDAPVTITGGVTVIGDVIADGIGLKTHTHTQPNDSAGNTESATAPGVG